MRKKKILFALKDMNIGGVEKSLISLVNEMDQSKYDVTVLLLRNYGGFMEEMPEWINVHILQGYSNIESLVNNSPLNEIKKQFKCLNILFAFELLIGYIFYKITKDIRLYYHFVFKSIKPLTDEYDVAISYTSIISYLSYFVNYKVKASTKIGWIHFDVNKVSVMEKTLYLLHKNYKKIYIVSKESYNNFVNMFPKLKEQCEVKYNIVSRKYIEKLAKEYINDMEYNGIKITTLGRLSKEKGQDIIPEIAFKLKEAGIDFRWYLIGEGNLRDSIEKDIIKYDLKDYVVLLGTKTNPYPYLKNTDIYVQTSRYEGNCISIEEAKKLYLPIVSANFSGIHEQIVNGVTGSIVDMNVKSLFDELINLIDNEDIRNFYSENLKN